MWRRGRCADAARLVLSTVVVLAIAWHPDAGIARGTFQVPRVEAAPAGMGLDGIQFSADVDSQANPIDERIEYDSHTERVWASFAFRDYGGEAMSYLVRTNGEDWRWGDLDCCESASGRFAFPIERRSGNDLGGAAYDVFVYANNAELGHEGFGVRGTRGFDSSGNDND